VPEDDQTTVIFFSDHSQQSISIYEKPSLKGSAIMHIKQNDKILYNYLNERAY